MLEWTDRESLYDRGLSLVKPARSVMDIGCGLRPQTIINDPGVLVCVEVHDEYITELRRRFAGTTTLILQGLVPGCLSVLPDRCIDTIMMLDFIEHLDRDAGLEALRECERLARRQVVVFTPLGFMPQDETGETDGWGLRGTYWQAHRSGWTPHDFDDRWHVVACRDFHRINGKGEELPQPFGAMWAVLDLTVELTAPVEDPQDGVTMNVLSAGLRQREMEALAKEIDLRKRELALRKRERRCGYLKRWARRLSRPWAGSLVGRLASNLYSGRSKT